VIARGRVFPTVRREFLAPDAMFRAHRGDE